MPAGRSGAQIRPLIWDVPSWDRKPIGAVKTEVVHNGDWILSLDLKGLLEVCSKFTVARILERAGVPMTPRIVVAIVDGAAVTSISEGLDVRETTGKLLDEAIEAYTKAAGC